MTNKILVFQPVLFCVFIVLIAACTPLVTATPIPTVTPTVTATATETPMPTFTHTATFTPSPSSTLTPTFTPTATKPPFTLTPRPTATPSATPVPPEGFVYQPSYGDCTLKPKDTFCIGFSDGYVILAPTSFAVISWDETGTWEGKKIQRVNSIFVNFQHILGTQFIKPSSKELYESWSRSYALPTTTPSNPELLATPLGDFDLRKLSAETERENMRKIWSQPLGLHEGVPCFQDGGNRSLCVVVVFEVAEDFTGTWKGDSGYRVREIKFREGTMRLTGSNTISAVPVLVNLTETNGEFKGLSGSEYLFNDFKAHQVFRKGMYVGIVLHSLAPNYVAVLKKFREGTGKPSDLDFYHSQIFVAVY